MTRGYGSITNRMNEGKQVGELVVGMGATEMLYSDREPFTVQKIISASRVIVTADRWKRTDSNGQSDCQVYEYESTPLAIGERELRCCHPMCSYIKAGIMTCERLVDPNENGKPWCDGCEHYKDVKPTNGLTLIKTKLGWKALGQDRRFALGVREKYEDPTF